MHPRPPRSRARTLSLSLACSLTACASTIAQPCQPTWIRGDPIPGVNGKVFGTTLWDRDGTGPGQPLIVAVGEFTIAGDQFAANVAVFNPASQRWSRCRDGLNGTARACTSIRNAAGGEDLIVGGDFSIAGGAAVQNLARFDGASWHDVGGGVNGSVRALASIPSSGTTSALYVGGSFTSTSAVPASYLAQWDGTNWSALGAGVNGRVSALSVAVNATGGQDLVVTGEFPVWSRAAFSRVAVWSGGTWTHTPQPGPAGPEPTGACALGWPRAGAGYDLVAGSTYYTFFNTYEHRVMQWSGSAWGLMHAPGVLLPQATTALGSARQGAGRPELFAASAMHQYAHGTLYRNNGSGWSGTGLAGPAYSLTTLPTSTTTDDLIAGGWFSSAGGIGANNIARYTPSSWYPLGPGIGQAVTRLARIRDAAGSWRLVAAGNFAIPLSGSSRLAYQSNGSWLWLGGAVNGQVRDMLVVPQPSGPDHLLIAGDFTTIGGSSIAHLARWNGAAWSAVSAAAFAGGGPVCMTLHPNGSGGDDLIVGGTFTSIGGTAANRIARWDGASWHAMSDGFSFANPSTQPIVSALASVPRLGGGADLYAGGFFDRSGSTARSSVCRWNGASWDDLGNGLGGGRFPIPFSTTQTVTINPVNAMDVVPRSGGGADLVVAGGFNSAGGIPARRIAKWDGASWSPMGLGLGPLSQDLFQMPYALAHMPNMQGGWDIFAAGMFTSADGLPVKQIARWDGAQWHDVDGGMDHEISHLLVVPGANGRSELYASGAFAQAGNAVSGRIAIANCPTPMCKTDMNGDRQVDFFDYLMFLAAFSENSDAADFNEDANIDFFDYLDFVAGLSLGC